MSSAQTAAVVYLALMSAAGFASMGRDKKKAKKGQMRTPELKLFMIAALGGCAGSLLGMYVFRHKTKHRTFTAGMPLILAVQAAIIAYIALK